MFDQSRLRFVIEAGFMIATKIKWHGLPTAVRGAPAEGQGPAGSSTAVDPGGDLRVPER